MRLLPSCVLLLCNVFVSAEESTTGQQFQQWLTLDRYSRQASVTHSRFYWVAVDPEQARPGQLVVASIEGPVITFEKGQEVGKLTLRLTDALLDLDQPITVKHEGRVLFTGKVPRTIKTLSDSLSNRPDPTQLYWSQLEVDPG